MTRPFRMILVTGMVLLVSVATAWNGPGASAQGPARSVRDGVYTAAQAERGEPLFENVCMQCHPDPFWRAGWVGQSVGDLFTIISTSMPDDNPGSLSTREVVEALAYMLRSNDLPAGTTELPEKLDELNQIRLEEPVSP